MGGLIRLHLPDQNRAGGGDKRVRRGILRDRPRRKPSEVLAGFLNGKLMLLLQGGQLLFL